MSRTRNRRQRGFSIVEMMVAVLISVILMTGVIQIFASNKATYEVTDELARLQENARFALRAMMYDLRMAGYFGCLDNIEEVYNHIDGVGGGDLLDTSIPIDGFDSADATQWQASGNTTDIIPTIGGTGVGDMVAGTDAFSVRYLDGSNPIVVESPYMPQASGNLKVSDDNGLMQGDIVAVTDCSSADIFQITGPSGDEPSTTGVLVHNTGASTDPGNANLPGLGACPGANAHCLSKIYEGDASVAKLVARRYFIGVGSDGSPTLFRQDILLSGTTITPDSQELINGVENLQLRYGRDTTGDAVPDEYVRADELAATDWEDTVVSVSVALLMRTPEEVRQATDLDEKTYRLHDEIIDPTDDRRYRRVFQTTALMRNLQ